MKKEMSIEDTIIVLETIRHDPYLFCRTELEAINHAIKYLEKYNEHIERLKQLRRLNRFYMRVSERRSGDDE